MAAARREQNSARGELRRVKAEIRWSEDGEQTCEYVYYYTTRHHSTESDYNLRLFDLGIVPLFGLKIVLTTKMAI